jgi:uncharacterized glyoxalase superfamily protein PhnB
MVEDVEEAAAFYQEYLGFQMVMSVPDKGKPDWALLRNGQVSLMCQSRRSLEGDIPMLRGKLLGGTVSFYCQMKGVDNLYDRLLGRVRILKTIEKTFYGATEFTMQDPYGYIFTFAED